VIDTEVRNGIETLRSQGKSNEEIKKALREKGYALDHIDNLLVPQKEHKKKQPVPKSHKKHIW